MQKMTDKALIQKNSTRLSILEREINKVQIGIDKLAEKVCDDVEKLTRANGKFVSKDDYFIFCNKIQKDVEEVNKSLMRMKLFAQRVRLTSSCTGWIKAISN